MRFSSLRAVLVELISGCSSGRDAPICIFSNPSALWAYDSSSSSHEPPGGAGNAFGRVIHISRIVFILSGTSTADVALHFGQGWKVFPFGLADVEHIDRPESVELR